LTPMLDSKLNSAQLNVLAGLITSCRCLEHSLRSENRPPRVEPVAEVYKIQ
jgi:hypothetical protein